MKSEKTIKAELESVEKQTEKYCADYGAGTHSNFIGDNINTFEWYLDEDKAQDSMCYDSGTQICSYGNKDSHVNIVIRGYVTVDYKDERYRHASEMPDELIKMFRNGKAYKHPDQIFILENNWYEVDWIKNGECVDGDVFEIGTPVSKKELEKCCKEILQEYKDWEEHRGL